jgi:hypothetical protein
MADPSSLSGLQDRLSLWESRLEKLQAFCDRDRQLLAAHQSPTRGIPTLNLTWPAVAPVLLDRAIPTNRTEHLLETKRDEHLEQVEDDGSGGQADVLVEFEKPSAVSPQFADADAATLPSRNQEVGLQNERVIVWDGTRVVPWILLNPVNPVRVESEPVAQFARVFVFGANRQW